MVAPLLLLASLIIPPALQQQTETVEQKIEVISGWLVDWKQQSSRIDYMYEAIRMIG